MFPDTHLPGALSKVAADQPGRHGCEHAGFHSETERVPGSQKRPDKAANANDLQHVIQMNGVRQLLEKRRTRNENFCHFLAPSIARRATALSISMTICCGSSANAAAPL